MAAPPAISQPVPTPRRSSPNAPTAMTTLERIHQGSDRQLRRDDGEQSDRRAVHAVEERAGSPGGAQPVEDRDADGHRDERRQEDADRRGGGTDRDRPRR